MSVIVVFLRPPLASDFNQEREFGYAGYDGMLELVRQLCLTIESPVWEAVRRPAPWAGAASQAAPLSAVAAAPLAAPTKAA